MKNNPSAHDQTTVDLPCVCALLRKAARVVTKTYDGHLKGIGLRITQYSMLMNIRLNPGVTVSELSELLRMDQTTVTRNLKVLETMDTISVDHDHADQRIRRISITKRGRSLLKLTRSSWEAAQSNMTQTLGEKRTKVLVDALQRLTSL